MLLPKPASNLTRLPHVGTHGTCEYKVSCESVVTQLVLVMRLALCIHGALGKGTLRTHPYWSFGDTIPVPTVARVHFLSSKLWYKILPALSVMLFLDNFWCLHTTIFEDNYHAHPKVRLHTSSVTRV
jgi:hypothetical protein